MGTILVIIMITMTVVWCVFMILACQRDYYQDELDFNPLEAAALVELNQEIPPPNLGDIPRPESPNKHTEPVFEQWQALDTW